MMPHRSKQTQTTIPLTLLFALFTIALSILTPRSSGQDMIFTTVVDDGDTINSPGPSPTPTVSSIDYAQWSGEALGIRTWDSFSRTYAGFWYPSVGELEYVAGSLYPFPDFKPISPTTNLEGNPPVAPRLTSGLGIVNNSDEFFMQQYVDDGGTDLLVESWPTLITAGPGTGIQQFAQRFITPVAMAPNEYAFYVTGVDLEDNHGWLQGDGSVQILINKDTPIPSELNNATHFFWSEPTKVLSDRTSIHIAGYNGSPSGNAIYTLSPSGNVKILVDSNGDVPVDVNLPAGGSWSSTLGTVSVNDSGRILFQGGVSKLGEFSRSALWSMDTSSDEPTLEASTSVPYPTNTVATVTFDSITGGLIDNAGNILFQARVDGESRLGVWRKLASGEFIRISPLIDSPLPGLPDFVTRTSSIVDMNTEGRCVIQIQATGSGNINAYFLESTKESLIYILAAGVPFGPDEESVSVTSIDLSDTGIVAMLLRVDIPNTHDDDDRVVIALDPDDVQPTGNKYIWDGGAGTSNWHTVVNGRTNWVDASGVPWDVPPNSEDAQIEIGIDAVVQLDQAIQLFSINLIKGSLEINAVLNCRGVVYVQEDASLVLQSFELDAQLIISEGLIVKEGDKTASLTGDTLSVKNSELVVEDGLLRLWCDTTLDGATLKVEGGTVNTGKLRFEGSAPRVEVLAGATLEIENPNLTFKSDTTISTEDGGHIKIGDSENEATITTTFETGFQEERRVLEFTGKGKIELFDPLNIPANAIVRNKSGFGIEAGLLIDPYEGDNIEESTIDGLFENTGVIALKGGGFKGNFKNIGWLEATPRQTGDLPVILDGENRGTVYLNARGMAYHDLTFESGSKLILKEGVFKSIIPSTDLTEKFLVFEKGSSIETVSGNWTINFSSSAEHNFGAALTINEGASLSVQDANTSGIEQMRISSTGILALENLKFKQLSIETEGRLDLSGDVTVTDSLFATGLIIAAKSFSVKDAVLYGDPSNRVANSYSIGSLDPGYERYVGTFENVAIENVSILNIRNSAKVVCEGFLSISYRIYVAGKLILTSDVQSVPLVSGGETVITLGASGAGQLQILSVTETPITIEPVVSIGGKDATVRVGEGTTTSFDVEDFSATQLPGTLPLGNWIVEDFGSLTINNHPQINEIGEDATVTLNRPHSSLGSLSDLPKPNDGLLILGELCLNNTSLDMTGKILRNKGTLKGKVIGDVQSIRGDVQGVIQLAGNIDIQGDLTMDTTLSLGASPGTGKISGDLTLLPGAEMIVEFGGTTPGSDFDFLEVGGTASLDGTLNLSLIDEYVPDKDDAFLFLKAGALAGDFDDIDQSNMGRQRRFAISAGVEGLVATASEITITTYASWRSRFFDETQAADDSISGPNADPDSDGLNNLSEYLHATSPLQSTQPPYTFDFTSDATFLANIQWAKNVTDYEWVLEISTDLEKWDPVAFTSELTSETSDSELHRILVGPASEKTFYRFTGKALNPL